MELHKDGETISCDKEQLDIMKKAGWSRSKNPEVKAEENDNQDNDGADNDGADNDGAEGADNDGAEGADTQETPEEDKPAPAKPKKKLKKKTS